MLEYKLEKKRSKLVYDFFSSYEIQKEYFNSNSIF